MQKNKNKAALEHALAALSDGSGHEEWGPWKLRQALLPQSRLALIAFDMATGIAADVVPLGRSEDGYEVVAREHEKRFIAAMRKLAPVILEVIQDAAERP